MVVYSTTFSLLSIIMAGGGPPSVQAIFWLFAVYYAFKGQVDEIRSLSKFVVFLVIVVGGFTAFWGRENPDILSYFSGETGLLFSVGLPLLTWSIMWGWASSKLTDVGNSKEDGKPENPATPVAQQAPTIESAPVTNFSKNSVTASRLGKPTQQRSRSLNSVTTNEKISNEPIEPIEPKESPVRHATPEKASASQVEAGKILVEYDEQVRAAFASLKGLPEAIKNQFLIEIGENPRAQVADVKKKVLLTALGRPELTWNQEFEDLIQNCEGANPDDVDELFRVFPALSKRMSPAQVFNKVIGGDREEFHVIKADGRPTAILRRSDGKFLMESSIGRRTFSSDQEVYEYLGTPKDKRNSLPR